jgi:hypothetical protein
MVRPGVAGRLPLGVRSVALPTAGVRPVVSAGRFDVAGIPDAENRTRLDARRFVGVVIKAPVSKVGLIGEITLARRLLRRAAGAIVSVLALEAMADVGKVSETRRDIGREIRSVSISSLLVCCAVNFRTGEPGQPIFQSPNHLRNDL